MKKYFNIFKTALCESQQFLLSATFEVFVFGVIIFLLVTVWSSIFSPQRQLNFASYTKEQLLCYILIAEAMCFGTINKSVTNEITYKIRSGDAICNISKPYTYPVYVLFKYLGRTSLRLSLFSVIAIIIGATFLGLLKTFNVTYIPLLLISFILAALIDAIFRVSICLTAFLIGENRPIFWCYEKILLIFGVFCPIDMLPALFFDIARVSPIFAIIYGPIKLFLKFSLNLFFNVLIVQVIYIILGLFFLWFIYKKGVKHLNVYGS